MNVDVVTGFVGIHVAMVTTDDREAADDVERLLRRLTGFLLRHSAEGAFELRDTVRQVAAAYGAKAEILAIAEGAVLTVRHADDSDRSATVRVNPELARLDLVAEGKFLVRRIIAGELAAAAAELELTQLERRAAPYPPWLRAAGVVLFAVGFAPSVQATWTEIGYSVVLGAVMAVAFVLAERLAVLRILLPIVGPVLVGLTAFGLLHAERQPGGPMILMVPALFVLIPGDFLCAATAEIAVGQLTPGAVRLAQAAFTLVEIAAGVLIAAEISGVGTGGLFEAVVPPVLPVTLIVASWVPFVFGLALAFSARMRDVPWMLALTYLAWGVQFGMTRWIGPTAGTFVAAALLAAVAGYLEISPGRPPRIVLILGGFFALTVGALALRGLTTIDGGFTIQGFNDIRDAITQTAALTLGLVVGAAPVQAAVSSRVGRAAEAGETVGGTVGEMAPPPR
jgi:uncharacterized membrane protein YjjP (DUF1212 family)